MIELKTTEEALHRDGLTKDPHNPRIFTKSTELKNGKTENTIVNFCKEKGVSRIEVTTKTFDGHEIGGYAVGVIKDRVVSSLRTSVSPTAIIKDKNTLRLECDYFDPSGKVKTMNGGNCLTEDLKRMYKNGSKVTIKKLVDEFSLCIRPSVKHRDTDRLQRMAFLESVELV